MLWRNLRVWVGPAFKCPCLDVAVLPVDVLLLVEKDDVEAVRHRDLVFIPSCNCVDHVRVSAHEEGALGRIQFPVDAKLS